MFIYLYLMTILHWQWRTSEMKRLWLKAGFQMTLHLNHSDATINYSTAPGNSRIFYRFYKCVHIIFCWQLKHKKYKLKSMRMNEWINYILILMYHLWAAHGCNALHCHLIAAKSSIRFQVRALVTQTAAGWTDCSQILLSFGILCRNLTSLYYQRSEKVCSWWSERF